MWYLISSVNPDEKFVILGGKVYVVGRKDADILIPGDATVSRKHAELSMSHPENNLANVGKLPLLKVKDLSKFGSWVNNQKVAGEKIVSDGDTVTFGSPNSSFMVVYEPLIVTSSCLDPAAKKLLRQNLCILGGHMTSEWQRSCSLLIMSRISVTIKVICALVSQKVIVTPEYLEAYKKYLQGTREKPDQSTYTPELAETQLDPSQVSFSPDSCRITIFQGMTFIFLSQKQFKKMSLAIELAGGTPLLLEEEGEESVAMVTNKHSVVMNCADAAPSTQTQTWLTRVQELLERAGRHMIQDAAIGYAVLYCSTEIHCNPEHFSQTDVSRLPTQSLSQMQPFVPNTETQHRTQTQRRGADTQTTVVNETRRSSQLNKTPASKTQSKSQAETEPPDSLVVKEEKITQPSTPTPKRKRGRAAEDEDTEDVHTATASKRVKAEPATPTSKTSTTTSKGGTSKMSDRKEKVQLDDWDSADDMELVTASTGKTQTRTSPRHRSASRSPVPSSRQTRHTNKAENDRSKASDQESQISKSRKRLARLNESDSDDGDDAKDMSAVMETEPSAKKVRTQARLSPAREQTSRNTRKGSPAPARSPSPKEEAVRNRGSPTPRRDQRSRNTESPTPRGTRNRQASPAPEDINTKQTGKASAGKSRSTKSRSRSRSPAHREKTVQVKSENVTPSTSGSSSLQGVVDTTDDAGKQSRSSRGQGDTRSSEGHTQSKREVLDTGYVDSDLPGENDIHATTLAAGFLSTTIAPIKTDKPCNVADADFPTNCVEVEFASLVARRPKPKQTTDGDCPDGFTRWKGKVVRNFKKFKKSEHAGSQRLPTIIGGSDLQVHNNNPSREMDDWLKETMQAESQHSLADRRAEELFNFNPGTRRGR